MAPLDLNLLVALDSLLDTGSVTEAARRLHTSPSAMSRTLARLRRLLDDPLLVRSGRHLVPTPRALALRPEVAALVERGRAVLAPRGRVDPATLARGFAVRADDLVLARLAGPLVRAVRAHAPGVTIRFLPDAGKGSADLRDGRVDLAVGVLEPADPEIVVHRVFGDRLVGVVAPGHPLDADRVTVAAYAGAAHLAVTRQGRPRGPIDDRLALHGRTRRVVATVPDLPSALLAVRGGELVCPAPAHLAADAVAALGLATFEIPLPLPEIPVGLTWHSRNTADAAHRWLRELVETLLAPPGPGRRRR
ncbi:LysR family transcriptional regulator [Nocardia farcinica]|uniref:LysR family transcriptional regulator n=1 Tax=Nocardia farcinica TaxID=37329 RepID=UPI0018951B59|nr:LysR family transcriptional regulator [Nocardia farcinica]MBF6291544.1 LysR family transcriptional regulator [Nocardia farcinica]MBF6373218.1 LysR family transcriptional regulator [Nocardia farcinica]MBF6378165.1 LysR family transcriptional regulator [Nocardia farcinica]